MPTTQWLVQCVLAIAAVVYSHKLEYDPNSGLEQPLGYGDTEVGQSDLYLLHKNLVNIESISGNEHDIGVFLESYLKDHNFTVEKQFIGPESIGLHNAEARSIVEHRRFNLLAYPGSKRQTRILLTSHIDTVPPFYGYDLRENDQLWGRGSVDAKACVATQSQALHELLASEAVSRDDVSLLFVVGEETGGDGMISVNDLNMEWETVIFGEPTELKLASGHKGILIFTVTAHGKAGHSGYPWLGANANHVLIAALAALQQLKLPSSAKYGNSTLNIGEIQGGVAANVIAETASAKIGIRIADGDPETVKEQILEAVRKVDPDNLTVEFHGGSYGPVYIDSDVDGFDTVTVNYGTDIPNLRGNHKRYLYGPGSILVAHSDHEHLAGGELLSAVGGYKKLILAALKK